VTFDPGAGKQLVDRVSDRFDWLERTHKLSARIRAGGAGLAAKALLTGIVVFGVTWAAASALLSWFRRLAARSRRARRPPSAAALRKHPWLIHTGFYSDMLDALARRGLGKPAWRPPLDHSAALTTHDAALGAAAARLSALYYTVRFGGRPLTDAQRLELDQCLAVVRAPSEEDGHANGPLR
jgi:uncharacterized iron-regulated membrane protein